MAKDKTLGELGLDPENMQGQEVDPLESLGRLGKDFVGALGGVAQGAGRFAQSLASPTESGETIADRNARIQQEQELQRVESQKEESLRADRRAQRLEMQGNVGEVKPTPSTTKDNPVALEATEINDGMGEVTDVSGAGAMWSASGKFIFYDGGEIKVPVDTQMMENQISTVQSSLASASPQKRELIMKSFDRALNAQAEAIEGWSEPAKISYLERINDALGGAMAEGLGVSLPAPDIASAFATSAEVTKDLYEGLPDLEDVSVRRTETVDNKKTAKMSDQIKSVWEDNEGEPVGVVADMIDLGLLEGVSSKADFHRRIDAVVMAVKGMNKEEENAHLSRAFAEEAEREGVAREMILDDLSSVLEASERQIRMTGGKREEGLAQLAEAIMGPQVSNLEHARAYMTKEQLRDYEGLPTPRSGASLSAGFNQLSQSGRFASKGQEQEFKDALMREMRSGDLKSIGAMRRLANNVPAERRREIDARRKEIAEGVSLDNESLPANERNALVKQALQEFDESNNFGAEIENMISEVTAEVSARPRPSRAMHDIDTPEEEAMVTERFLAHSRFAIENDADLTKRMFADYQTSLIGGNDARADRILDEFIINRSVQLGGSVADEVSKGLKTTLAKMRSSIDGGTLDREFPQMGELRSAIKSRFREYTMLRQRENQLRAQSNFEAVQMRQDVGLAGDIRNLQSGTLPEASKFGIEDRGEFEPQQFSFENMSTGQIENVVRGFKAKYPQMSPRMFQELDKWGAEMVAERVQKEYKIAGFENEEKAQKMGEGLLAIDESQSVKDIRKDVRELGIDKGTAKDIAEDIKGEGEVVEIK